MIEGGPYERPLVVKLGGGDSVDLDACLDDLARIIRGGRRVVVVHGGRSEIDALGVRLGSPSRHALFASGASGRLTDPVALEVLTLALEGRVKPRIVAGLVARGIRAVGLSGVDAGIVRARRKTALKIREGDRARVVRDDLSGRIVEVDAAVFTSLLEAGLNPVLSPPALGEGGSLNVDADRMAAAIAAALRAGDLLFLTDVAGVLRDADDPATSIDRLEANPLVLSELPRGRMRHKALAGLEALAAGVGRVVVAAGCGEAPVEAALHGRGTVLGLRREQSSAPVLP